MRLPGVGGRTLSVGMEQKGCRRLVGKDLATRMLTGLGSGAAHLTIDGPQPSSASS